MKKIKLLMTDLDDTVLYDNTFVSQKTKDIIEELLDNEVEVVFASGRYFDTIPDYFLNNKRVTYIASSNGALITNIKTNEVIYNKMLDYKQALEIIKMVDHKAKHLFIVTDEGPYIDKRMLEDESVADNEFFMELMEQAKVLDSIYDYIKESKLDVKKIEVGFDDLEFRNKIYKELHQLDGVAISSSHLTNIDATSDQASKGKALEFLMDKLSIDKQHTMAIGDNDNDVSMITAAGIGVAMDNATPFLKQNADMTTKSIKEEGFYYAIKKVFNN